MIYVYFDLCHQSLGFVDKQSRLTRWAHFQYNGSYIWFANDQMKEHNIGILTGDWLQHESEKNTKMLILLLFSISFHFICLIKCYTNINAIDGNHGKNEIEMVLAWERFSDVRTTSDIHDVLASILDIYSGTYIREYYFRMTNLVDGPDIDFRRTIILHGGPSESTLLGASYDVLQRSWGHTQGHTHLIRMLSQHRTDLDCSLGENAKFV